MSRAIPRAAVLAVLLLAPGAAWPDAVPDPVAAIEQAIAGAETLLQSQDRSGAEGVYRGALFEGWLLRAGLDRVDQRPDDGRAALVHATALAPPENDALRALATAQLQAGEIEPATAILARLAGLDARDVETRRLLAKALGAAGRMDDAVATLDEAARLAASDPERTFLVATEYLWLKRPDAAAALFARIVAAHPRPETHVLIGRAYRDAGEGDRAEASLRAALALDPSVRRAHYYLGMVRLADQRRGRARLDEAIAELRAELALAPEDALANDQLGSALLEAERPAEAVPAFEAAVRAEPRYLYALHLGRGLLALDRAKDGVDALRRALARASEQNAPASDLETIHYQLGLGLRRMGAAAEAAPHLTEARRLSTASAETAAPAPAAPDTSPLADLGRAQRDAWRRRVHAALARGSFNLGLIALQDPNGGDALTRAASLFETTAALDPEFPRVQSALGAAYFRAARYTQATGALAVAVRRQPDDAAARRMLALSWLNTETWDEAAPLLRDDPERAASASLQLAYGVALARGGRAAEAVAPLEAAARLAPAQADVQLELSKAYGQLGRAAEAQRSREAYERLQARPPGSAR